MAEPKHKAPKPRRGGRVHGPPGRRKLMRDLALMKRRRVALEMKTAGYTYREIAEQCGVSVQVAFHDVNMLAGEESALTEAMRDRNRAMEDHGIAMLRRELVPMIRMEFGKQEDLTGMEMRRLQIGAIGKYIQTQVRRAKLHGLDLQQGDDAGGGGNRPWQHLSDDELSEKTASLAIAIGIRVDAKALTEGEEE